MWGSGLEVSGTDVPLASLLPGMVVLLHWGQHVVRLGQDAALLFCMGWAAL